jgi:Alpha amylase, C-terminal all-beta domain
LRNFYTRLLGLVGEPAFHDGEFFALNYANSEEPGFGRLDGETASGHWLYAFLRSDRATAQRFLVVVNLHPSKTFTEVRVRLPSEALEFVGLTRDSRIRLVERLTTCGSLILESSPFEGPVQVDAIPPLTPYYFAFQNV